MLKFSNSQDFYFNTDENGRQVVLTVRYAMVKIDPLHSVDSINSGVHLVGAFPPNCLSGLRSPGCIISFEQPELFATKIPTRYYNYCLRVVIGTGWAGEARQKLAR